MVGPFNSPIRIQFYGRDYLNASYAQTAFDAVTGLGRAVANLQIPLINPSLPPVPAAPPLVEVTAPNFQNVTWAIPNAPNAFNDTLNVDSLLPDAFDEDPPELIFAGAPDSFTEVPPTPVGVDLTVAYPNLDVSLPAPPSLLSLNIAPFGGTILPTFSATEPILTAVEPTVRTYTPGSMYSSALLTELSSTLKSRIQNGGTGLPPAIEQAIWDRAREREYKQVAAALADLDRMENLGYAFPPGIYADARIKIQTEANYNIANQSREVMIKQAELELANILKALDTSTQLESRLIEYTNQVEQRAFEASKFETQAYLEIYNAKVRAFATFVDAYKAKVAIYEAQVRAEATKVEIYKAQVAAEEAKAQINTALVNQYKVASDIALSAIEVYKAKIAGIQAKADIEKTKVMIYGEQVRGYVAQINAYTAQIEAYKAQVQTEATKQEAFKSKVQAYSAQVDAAAKVIQAKIEEYKGKIQAKESEYEGYKTIVTAESEKARAITANNQALASAFQAQATSRSAFNESLIKRWSDSVDLAQKNASVIVEAAKANASSYLNARQLAVDALKAGGTVAAQVAAAAFNQYNETASLSGSFGVTNSYSGSESFTYSQSLSA